MTRESQENLRIQNVDLHHLFRMSYDGKTGLIYKSLPWRFSVLSWRQQNSSISYEVSFDFRARKEPSNQAEIHFQRLFRCHRAKNAGVAPFIFSDSPYGRPSLQIFRYLSRFFSFSVFCSFFCFFVSFVQFTSVAMRTSGGKNKKRQKSI